MKLILASASPARVALLRAAGLDFRRTPSGIREPAPARGESLHDYLVRLARLKAMAVGGVFPASAVLAADTALCLAPVASPGKRLKIIGKPGGPERAVRMLRELSGREHLIGTGVCLVGPGEDNRRRTLCGYAMARVRLRELSAADIRAYVDRVQPWQCAGAYALQGAGAAIVAHIRGDPTTIIGLPMKLTLRLLHVLHLPK